MIGGRPYYYMRFTARVNGRPKVVRTVYLGKPEDIFAAVQGLTVGEYLAIAVVNRAVCPKSKRKIGPWVAKTILPRLIQGLTPRKLTGQRFWDHMDRVAPETIEAIETDFTRRLVEQFGLDLRCLAFDATNFFTFINTRNTKADLAQRGHNKNGRNDLRQISLALLVSTDFHVPLFHEAYEGNRPDAVEFRSALSKLRQRQEEFTENCQDITLVFDKGNNSADGFEMLDEMPFHFVGSLSPTQHPDLLAVPLEEFHSLDSPRLEQVSAYRTRKKVFGVQRTIVVTFNDNLYTAQLTTLTEQISKARGKLDGLQRRLARHRNGRSKGKRPTLAGTNNQVKAILKARHLKDALDVRVFEKEGHVALTYRVNQRGIDRLCSTLFGRTILFSDNGEWSDDEIVLALTMVSLLQRELHHQGIDVSISETLESLSEIKEVALFHTRSRKNPLVTVELTERDELQDQLFDALDLKRFSTS